MPIMNITIHHKDACSCGIGELHPSLRGYLVIMARVAKFMVFMFLMLNSVCITLTFLVSIPILIIVLSIYYLICVFSLFL